MGENLLKSPWGEDTCPEDATKHWSLCIRFCDGKGSKRTPQHSLGSCQWSGVQTVQDFVEDGTALHRVLPAPDALRETVSPRAPCLQHLVCPLPSPWCEYAAPPPRAKLKSELGLHEPRGESQNILQPRQLNPRVAARPGGLQMCCPFTL